MSISSFTMVTMLDTRPSPITISMPRTNDIPNRVITFKDIYGNAPLSTITLVTQGGDVFENGLFSTILSNAYDTVTFHAGLPGRWHRTGGTNVVGGMNASSTFTNSLSTSYAYINTISSANLYGKHIGDGSGLTNLSLTFSGTTNFNNITVSNTTTTCNISTGYITGCNISNSGTLSNLGGSAFFAATSNTGTLGVVGATTLNGLSNNGNISNVGAISNSGAFSNLGGGAFFASTSNTGTLGVASLTTTNGLSNNGNLSNLGGVTVLAATSTNSIYNSGDISTNTLHAGTAYFLNTALFTSTSNLQNLGVAGAATLNGISNNGTISNVGAISNSGAFSNLGGTAFLSNLTTTASAGIGTNLTVAGVTGTSNLSNVGWISNSGVFSNLGGTAFMGALTTTSHSNTGLLSNSGAFSNIGGNAALSNLTTTASAAIGTNLTVAGVTGMSNLSNVGWISNSGAFSNLGGTTSLSNLTTTASAGIGTNLTVAGVTGTSNLSNVGWISNSGALSNLGGGTFLGTTTTAGLSNTGTMCNSGLLSTNTLNAGAISNNNLTFYDQYTASTGTFRYSTLTTLVALPNTSVLLFNNFIVAGAYVWPGQTIKSLSWTGSINQCNLGNTASLASGAQSTLNAVTGSNIFSIFTGVTGGTPPYRIIDVTVGYSGPLIGTGVTGYSPFPWVSTFADYNGFPNTGPSQLSTNLGNLTNFSSMLYSGPGTAFSLVGPSNQTAGRTNYALRLLDSSTPAFSRDIQFNWAL